MPNTKKPNLIYVFADQLRFDALGFNAEEMEESVFHGKTKTPNIDKLSEECLCLDNAISGHPVCAPYRASLFTGKYTTSTGMVINELRINTGHKTIGNVLTEEGYETCYIGKWHLYANQLGHHYNTKNSYVPKGPDRLGFDDVFAGYNFHHEYYAPKAYYHLDSEEKQEVSGYEPDFMTDYALEHLQRLKERKKPVALFLSLGTPHDPWTKENVPKEYLERLKDINFELPKNYKKANDPHADMWARLKPKERAALKEWMRVYTAMVANLDDNIGRFVEKLKEMDLWDNSIFVFTSDHGEMFGAQGRRAKNIFYDEALKVPFILHCGDNILGKVTNTNNAFENVASKESSFESDTLKGHRNFVLNSVDIMPTLLSMMDLPNPETVQGRDLSNCILENADSGEGALLMGTGPTAIYGNGREWRGYRTKEYTYAIYKKDGEEHLYNNIEDPLQMNNLAQDASYAEIKKELSSAMKAKMAEIGDEDLSCRQYKRKYIKNRIIQRV